MMPKQRTSFRLLLAFSLLTAAYGPSQVYAQGQDSTPWERDLLVLTEMLPGRYDNIDQFYFERRRGADANTLHRRMHTRVTGLSEKSEDQPIFLVQDYFDNDLSTPAAAYLIGLIANNDAQGVDMTIAEHKPDAPAPSLKDAVKRLDQAKCVVRWTRGAASFQAVAVSQDCHDTSFELSTTYFFRNDRPLGNEAPNATAGHLYHLARAREFDCYLDYPGASGGADIPFKRHTGIRIHDKGGYQDITVQDGRVFRLTLRLVDWPINNYEGFFSRDSLVIYLAEVFTNDIENLAYAFTEPDVGRVAINLRSVMGRCFQVSGYDQKPFF